MDLMSVHTACIQSNSLFDGFKDEFLEVFNWLLRIQRESKRSDIMIFNKSVKKFFFNHTVLSFALFDSYRFVQFWQSIIKFTFLRFQQNCFQIYLYLAKFLNKSLFKIVL